MKWLKQYNNINDNLLSKLSRSFYNRPTLTVAKELIGKHLYFYDCIGEIIETEAYIGKNDPACHACNGKTPRNKAMFGLPGYSYVYFIYGMYFCLNFVTENDGFPAAVLIRALKPVKGIESMKMKRNITDFNNLTSGPGKLCQALGISKKFNNIDICNNKNFYVKDCGFMIENIKTTPRIGIKNGQDLLYRFVLDKSY